MKLHRLLPALVISMCCLSVCAHDADDTPGRWDGSTINAGGVLNTGNTDSSSLTGALKLKFEEHCNGKGNYDFLLWKILIFCIWLNKKKIKI